METENEEVRPCLPMFVDEDGKGATAAEPTHAHEAHRVIQQFEKVKKK